MPFLYSCHPIKSVQAVKKLTNTDSKLGKIVRLIHSLAPATRNVAAFMSAFWCQYSTLMLAASFKIMYKKYMETVDFRHPLHTRLTAFCMVLPR